MLTLDAALQDAIPALLAPRCPARGQLDLTLAPTESASNARCLKRVLLRESQEQPLLLVFEDLHWID